MWHRKGISSESYLGRSGKKMGFDMNAASLKKLCREKRLYASLPELNEVLHLHHKGIVEIKGLESYTGLKTLHLECNAITKIENLDHLINLRCLYLNQNLLEDVKGLEKLPRLESLDLADNQIKCLRGLSCCQSLRQLDVSGNMICQEDDVAPLTMCKTLQSLDLSNNKIDNKEAVEIIQSLPLILLKMSGNPIVSMTQHYRKFCVVQMPMLTYLDESPVSDKERRLARAWTDGGIEEEQSMRETIRKEEADQRDVHRQAFDAMIRAATLELAEIERKKREQAAREEQERSEEGARQKQQLADIAAAEEQQLAAMAEAKRRSDFQEKQQAELAAIAQEREAELAASDQASKISEEWILEQVECAENEKKFKKELQERVLERTAVALENRDNAAFQAKFGRPMLWGTRLSGILLQLH